MRGQNTFVFNLNMIIHIFLHLSNAFSAGPAGRRGRGEAFSRVWMPAAGGCAPFCRRTRAGIWCFFPKTAGGRAAKRCIRPNFGIEPPGSLVPPAAGPPCRQGSPEEPLRATTGKVRGAAKNFSQGRSFPFLSTLPVRGATCYSWRSRYRRWYFYPRSPQGERQRTFPSLPISPLFLSTLPAKGSDPSATGAAPGWPYFYPHSPQGERRQNPTNIKDVFCAKVPNGNLKYTKHKTECNFVYPT